MEDQPAEPGPGPTSTESGQAGTNRFAMLTLPPADGPIDIATQIDPVEILSLQERGEPATEPPVDSADGVDETQHESATPSSTLSPTPRRAARWGGLPLCVYCGEFVCECLDRRYSQCLAMAATQAVESGDGDLRTTEAASQRSLPSWVVATIQPTARWNWWRLT